MVLHFSDCDPIPQAKGHFILKPIVHILLKHLEHIEFLGVCFVFYADCNPLSWYCKRTVVWETLNIPSFQYFLLPATEDLSLLIAEATGGRGSLYLGEARHRTGPLLFQGVWGLKCWLQLKGFKVKHSPSHSDTERRNGFLLHQGGKLETLYLGNLLGSQNKITTLKADAILVFNHYISWYTACVWYFYL